MWTPLGATELEHAAQAGELRETTTFDAKVALPQPRKNRDLAEDVCAMTVDGGVLVYGVAEDEQRNPTLPRPLQLAGQRERIDQVVQTSIAEVPFIDIRALPLEDDPARGYLAVVVPPSPRAPHQVTVGGEFRYYGRGATGNRRLSEGEVARLYRRREEWQVDRQALLAETIGQAPVAPRSDLGYLHAFARPVSPNDQLWERAVGGSDPDQLLWRLRQAATGTRPHSGYVPALSSLTQWARRGADVWTLDAGETRDGRLDLRFDLNVDGRGYLFVGRAAERLGAAHGQGPGELVLFEEIVAGNLASFLSLHGAFYENAGYNGPVDVGVAVTGIEGASSAQRRSRHTFEYGAYGAPTYTRTARVSAQELLEAETVAGRLLRRLLDASAWPGYNPFAR